MFFIFNLLMQMIMFLINDSDIATYISVQSKGISKTLFLPGNTQTESFNILYLTIFRLSTFG